MLGKYKIYLVLWVFFNSFENETGQDTINMNIFFILRFILKRKKIYNLLNIKWNARSYIRLFSPKNVLHAIILQLILIAL